MLTREKLGDNIIFARWERRVRTSKEKHISLATLTCERLKKFLKKDVDKQ